MPASADASPADDYAVTVALVVAIVVALIGAAATVWVASRNRKAQREDRTVESTGTERQFLLEKFNELADGFEKRWRDADAKWAACEEREAVLRQDLDAARRDLDKLRVLLRTVGQHLSIDDAEDPTD